MVRSPRRQEHEGMDGSSGKRGGPARVASRLSGEDLAFWWFDSPMQPTTMAMLLVLDSPPEELRLRLAFERAVTAVPRLAQRVVDAPLDLTLPRWEFDPTFDLDYHVRRHPLCGRADMDELFREVGPFYETAFDRSRPLWEARLYDGLGPDHQSALFFKLHHAVADGVGGNAIFAALTDAEREPAEPAGGHAPQVSTGAWAPQRLLGARVLDAIRDRVELDVERAAAVAGAVVKTIEHPAKVARLLPAIRSIIELMRFESQSPLKNSAGRARRLSSLDLPFAEIRRLKHQLGGSMIDVILTIMAQAIGKWYAAHRISKVRELMTLVPVNLRKPDEWAAKPHVGNVATGILVPLPIRLADPLATYREVHKRMEAKKADPLSTASPMLAELLSCLPHALVTWMAEATFGRVDFIITNIPGILMPRYLAGAEIVAAYPFAPVAMKSPVSVALYGYRDRLFVGLNSDDMLMPDIDAFKGMIHEAFERLRAAIGRRQSRTARRRRVP
ncbi:MAG TPA: wax ester/triacylglycerol synthase domain-containing protein [Candidatus Binatia bacterium]